MSFKKSTGDRFRPSIDPFGGRGTQKGGLNHGGQYSVDYILDKSKGQPRRKKSSSIRSSVSSYLQDAPPVAAPRPTSEEKARMKRASGDFHDAIGDVIGDYQLALEIAKVRGAKKEEIREALKGFTCFRQAQDGYTEECNGIHAMYQVTELGNCTQGAEPLSKLEKCADGTFSFGRCVNFRLDETFPRKLYLQKIAGEYASELSEAMNQCQSASMDFTYGCTDESALNYNPEADGDDGSCEFAQESDQPDGSFENEGFNFDPLLDQLPPEYGGGMQIQPAPGTKTAGVQIKPVQLIAFLGLAAVIFFVANRPKAQA